MKHTTLILSTVCMVTFCVGCSTAEPVSTASEIPQSTIPVSPTDTPKLPTETPVPLTETPAEAPVEFPRGRFYNGSFDSSLIINDDGTWRLLEGANRTFFTGLYQVEGDMVTFTDRTGVCFEYGDGIYRWEFLEGVLSLNTVNDNCKLRTLRLTFPYAQQ